MANIWNLGVSSVDGDGNLHCSGSIRSEDSLTIGDGNIADAFSIEKEKISAGKLDILVDTTLKLEPAFLFISNLSTSDPQNAGQIWNNGGVVSISAG